MAGSQYGAAPEQRSFQSADNWTHYGTVNCFSTRRELLHAILAVVMPATGDPAEEGASSLKIGKTCKSISGHGEMGTATYPSPASKRPWQDSA